MGYCATCGKELKHSEEFTVNGIVQCEECAYSNIISEKTEKTIVQHGQNNTLRSTGSIRWSGILKTINRCILIVGIIASLIGCITAGFAIGGVVGFLVGLGVFIGGTILSVAGVAVSMTFAYMAEDIAIIRQSLNK